MEEKLHPELDDSPLCDNRGASLYRSIIGSLNWIITIGNLIPYTTMSLTKFNTAPREGHSKAVVRIWCYLKAFQGLYLNWKIGIQIMPICNTCDSWLAKEFYPDTEEDTQSDILHPKQGICWPWPCTWSSHKKICHRYCSSSKQYSN